MHIPDILSNLKTSDMLTLGPILGFIILQQVNPIPGINLPVWIVSVAGAAMAITKIILWLRQEIWGLSKSNDSIAPEWMRTHEEKDWALFNQILQTQSRVIETQAINVNTQQRILELLIRIDTKLNGMAH